jgi:hypothetical protein
MPETIAPADTPFTQAEGRQVLIVNPADFPVQLSALPAGTEAIGTVGVTSFPVVGTTGNAWNDVAVAAGGVSSTVNTGGLANVSVYGNVSASGTMSVNVSADGTTFYPSSNSDAISAAGDFYMNFTCGAQYLQLAYSEAATITATISTKG